MQLKKLPNRAKSYKLVKSLLILSLFLVVSVVVSYALNYFELKSVIPAVWIVFGILTLFAFIYPFLSHKMFGYDYDEEKIVIKRGVVFRHYVCIPVCQIQDLHLLQGPFMLLFGLSGLIVSTAGSNFFIPCLNTEDAKNALEKLQAFLKNRIEEKAHEEI